MRLTRDLPTVLYSIETMSREFDAKLMMAVALAGRGCRAIVGHKEDACAIAKESRRIVWQGKSVGGAVGLGTVIASALRQNESALMFHHDEGAIFPSNVWTDLVLQKHEVEFWREHPIDLICTWGDRQVETIGRHAPELRPRLVATGTPRFDLCSPAYDWVDADPTNDARDRRRPFLLVNTRFPMAVHADGYRGQFEALHKQRTRNPEPEARDATARWFDIFRKDGHEFVDFVVMIKELALAFPRHTIVIRPHPSESADYYAAAFSTFPNVVVNRTSSVLYWIRGADLVVHNNCTTGVEAILAGKPVVQFLPNGPTDGDMTIAGEAGCTVTTVADAIAAVAAALEDGRGRPQRWSQEALGSLRNLTAPSIPTFVEATLDLIGRKQLASSDVVLPRSQRRLAWWRTQDERPAYVRSKRGHLDPRRVEAFVSECDRTGLGRAKIRHLTPTHVVLEPV